MSRGASGDVVVLSGPTFSAAGARALTLVSGALSAFFFCVLCVTISVDGSPFRRELLTPWMNATLVDYYLTLAPFLCWVALRERQPLVALLWAAGLCCSGSVGVWGYVWLMSLRVRAGDSIAKVLLP